MYGIMGNTLMCKTLVFKSKVLPYMVIEEISIQLAFIVSVYDETECRHAEASERNMY
jgi:hypothetical protein